MSERIDLSPLHDDDVFATTAGVTRLRVHASLTARRRHQAPWDVLEEWSATLVAAGLVVLLALTPLVVRDFSGRSVDGGRAFAAMAQQRVDGGPGPAGKKISNVLQASR